MPTSGGSPNSVGDHAMLGVLTVSDRASQVGAPSIVEACYCIGSLQASAACLWGRRADCAVVQARQERRTPLHRTARGMCQQACTAHNVKPQAHSCV